MGRFLRPTWSSSQTAFAQQQRRRWPSSLGRLAVPGSWFPSDRPTDTPALAGILIWCADRLQAVKWRNYKVHFYQQETMISPPVKLPVPFLFNLYTNPHEDENKPTLDTWVIGPVLKMIGAFEESLKQHPLIPMGTPDPYRPPPGGR